MNKKSKYYFIITRLILSFTLSLCIGALLKIADIYQYIEPNLFSVFAIIMHVFNTLLIIAVCIIGLYLIYQIFSYFSSAFYRDYKINILEAFVHGTVDMYVIYDKIVSLADSKTIKIDFSNNIITFARKGKYFSILFADLFGKIDGKEGNDYWYSLKKPQKKYGRIVYANTIRFFNPILVNQKYVAELKKETDHEYQDYVVLTGFYQLDFTHRKLISPYEILSIIDRG